jgi:succinate-semialdehyde dehydrogenase/glutarate-semialdehyde dehydrogenase
MLRAGFPRGVVQNLFLSNDQAARLIADERVRGVTLTGSTRAGKQVAQAGGKHLKPTVMELGGSDPFIVLDDADVERAVEVGVDARCQNSGQSCIAAKRFLVHRSVADSFRQGFVAAMQQRVVGDPTDAGVEIGPLARADLRNTLVKQVARTTAAGASVLCGGKRPEGRGFFYPPTVLAEVPAGTPAAEEELFGPVATLTVFEDEDEAVELANSTRYGLGASLWTSDVERAKRLIPEIESGSVFVNGLVKSDPRLPFGGVKQSGFGRELAREGMMEFVNLKTVWFA